MIIFAPGFGVRSMPRSPDETKKTMEQKKILITGASGFVGSAIVDKALRQGFETWAGVRAASSRAYLQDPRIRFIDLDYAHAGKLIEQIARFVQENGKFDYIIHCAGVTKTPLKTNFYRVNFQYTRNLVEALIQTDAIPESFVLISTLSVMGPGDEKNYTPFMPNQRCNPNTHYGDSKLLTENYLKTIDGFPYVILRPTGVYGPRDKDYLLFVRMVKKGFDVKAGLRKQLLTFIHAEDLAEVALRCIEKKIYRKEYFVADGNAYTDNEFTAIIREILHKKGGITLRIPLIPLKAISFLSEKINGIFGKASTLNTDKYHIMKQRNWNCDTSLLAEELDFKPRYQLREGFENTIAWYRENGWL